MLYFDYNSTHPPIKQILIKNLNHYLENFSNPSGINFYSQKNFSLLEQKRNILKQILQKFYYINPLQYNIVFNSTGTESVYQMVYSYFDPEKPIVIVSPYEHECFYKVCEDVNAKTIFLSANSMGFVEPKEIHSILNKINPEEVSFISCIAVSNETGIIQPIKELASISKEYNIPFISDTIQIAGKRPMDIDLVNGFTINGHKIGAGYGCSIYVGKKAKPIFRGGLQENELRAGTENLPAIFNTVDAFLWQMENQNLYEKTKVFQNQIEDFLKQECNAIIVGELSPRISTTTYALFPDIDDFDFLMMYLDQEGIVYSTGSSCKSRTRQASELLIRMGYSKDLSQKALRFSYGIFTTEEEVQIFIEKFKKIYKSFIKV